MGTQNTVPYCQKYTPIDCSFGNFDHWDVKQQQEIREGENILHDQAY